MVSGGAYRLYLRGEIVQVNKKIDTDVGKCIHAPLVFSIRVNMIDSDGIGAKVLHLLCIAFALVGVDKWICGDELVCDA